MRWLAGGALLLALGLAGCGGSGGGGGNAVVPASGVEAAALKTAQAGSVKADFTISGSGVSGTGSGVFDGGRDRAGRLSLNLSANGQRISLDSVIAGNDVYLRSPLLSQRLPGDKKWVKVDLPKLAKQMNIDAGGLLDTNPTPAAALAFLAGTSRVRKVGTDTVGGVSTTHYRVTVDLARAASRAQGSDRDAIRSALQLAGAEKQPVDVWTDAQGYVCKIEYAARTGSAGVTHLTMELHDFGSHVTINPPPTNAVADLLQAILGG
jgi:hypothetical protein